MIDIGVVIVGFNSREYARRCLGSLAAAAWGGFSHRVVYVDNASVDGSVEMVRREFPEVQAIANGRNVGFSAACNQGAAAAAGSRYIYLLNNDTIAFPDSVRRLAEFLERTPSAGVAANRLLNPDLSDQWSARRFPTWINAIFGRRSLVSRWFPQAGALNTYLYKDALAAGQPFAVDWVPGSCSLVRRAAYEQVGGVPEDMHYWSDAVFCDRIRKRGWEIYVVSEARLIHDEGHGTGGKTAEVRRWLIRDFHKGAYRFYCEHYELGAWNPARWLAAMGLRARAQLLIAADSLRERRLGA
ncbi:MAG TPA: glycosyltransferase family 2 protein [Bryobacteraceae bacterium]|nr:glycosyltransferase family 2 protein [Bryobacteraceae bacterium]